MSDPTVQGQSSNPQTKHRKHSHRPPKTKGFSKKTVVPIIALGPWECQFVEDGEQESRRAASRCPKALCEHNIPNLRELLPQDGHDPIKQSHPA